MPEKFQIGDRPQNGNKPEWREDEADRDPKGQQDLLLEFRFATPQAPFRRPFGA
jgi:hypothetical protein